MEKIIQVQNGFQVTAFFDHYSDEPEKSQRSGMVIEVMRRYGLQNLGTTPINDLVTIKKDNGEIDSFDVGFITSCKRPDHFTHYPNYSSLTLRKGMDRSGAYPLVEVSGGNVSSYGPEQLVRWALAGVRIPQVRRRSIAGIDFERMALNVFNICRRIEPLNGSEGVLEAFHGYILTVRRKRLEKWVRQNLNRYILTKKEVDAIETEYHTECERELMEDFELWTASEEGGYGDPDRDQELDAIREAIDSYDGGVELEDS